MRSIKEQLVLVYCLADEGLKSEKNGGNWRRIKQPTQMHWCGNYGGGDDAELFWMRHSETHLFIGDAPLIHRLFRICRVTNNGSPDGINWVFKWARFPGSVPLNITDLDEIYLIDSFPIPMCQAIRHGRVNLLRDDGAYFGKGTKGWFFGFKLHVLSTNSSDSFWQTKLTHL